MNTIKPVRTTNHYTQENIKKFEKLIHDENDYLLFMESIRATRKGLFEISQKRPELRNKIKDQFDTLNNLFSALLPVNDYDYPKY